MPRKKTDRVDLYFLRSRLDGAIKIGSSTNVPARVAQLCEQHGDDLEVLLVLDGHGRFEYPIHRGLRSEAIYKPLRGLAPRPFTYVKRWTSGHAWEWYAPTPRVLDLVESARRDPINCIDAFADGSPCSELDAYLAAGG